MKKFKVLLFLLISLTLTVSCAKYQQIDCDSCHASGKVHSSCTTICISCGGLGLTRTTCGDCGGLGMKSGYVYQYDYFTNSYKYVWQTTMCYSCISGSVYKSCFSCVAGHPMTCNKCVSGIITKNCTTCHGTGKVRIKIKE